MWTASKEFKTPALGLVKKGQEVEYKKAWEDGGLIEQKPHKEKVETKPEPKKKKASK